ncbi:hypothetical protein PHISP_02489 [Aspergillus sp. HF37]|nr:hypothetical protein PHISP_02489 [Aspergillus sp. HF37]
MTFNITIDPSPHASDHSSVSDEEDSSGVQVSPPSDLGSHDFHDPYDEWAHLPYPDELKPSDSASRPRTSHHSHRPVHGPRSGSGRRRVSRRHLVQERESLSRRRRPPSPESPESADSADEYPAPYGRLPQGRRFWPSATPDYAHSSSSGPSYVYPHGAAPNANRASSRRRRITILFMDMGLNSSNLMVHLHLPSFFMVTIRGIMPKATKVLLMAEAKCTIPPNGQRPMLPILMDLLMSRESYPMVPPGMVPHSYFGSYPRVPSPNQVESSPSPAQASADVAKDEAIARLEKLILEERTEREARQAALEQEAAEKAAKEEKAAHEKKIAMEAAAVARAEAEQKAADEAVKAKEEAEKVAAAAAAEAAAAATEAANAAAASQPPPPPPEKKKPIKFKDAGMEELIRQAFLHIEVIGPHVAEGHYDLVGPNGDIILPQVWETVVEPDWTITMHMWPIPEKPKSPEPQPPPEVPPPPPDAAVVVDEGAVVAGPQAPKKSGPKKPRPKGDPGAFAMWMVGSNRSKLNKSLKAEKKPEVS